MRAKRTALLLLNLGTPESPETGDVRRYLKQFLFDPRVIDIHPIKRWLLLNLIILRFRPKQSGEAYAKIWTDRGSPLLFHSQDLATKVQARLGEEVHVELGMRYGNPSTESAIAACRDAGAERLVVFPLYPQYSSAATGSSVEEVFRCASQMWNTPYIQIVPPFYDHPGFIDSCAAAARPTLDGTEAEKVFFSFHGLPERHVQKSDLSGNHCLQSAGCCDKIVDANRHCYRAQCYATARLLGDRLGIPEKKRIVCFQSRLGRDPWIRPYTDELLVEEAKSGTRRAIILSPAFVADCLETIEELGMRAVEDWKAAGGESLELIPCVNSRDDWADAVVDIAREHSGWLTRPAVAESI